jgi:hypothetical protein
MRGLDPRIHPDRPQNWKVQHCRVKLGNDEWRGAIQIDRNLL